ncbi:transglutaminaseTgpA domain-containing protein [Pseudonocardia sp.]|uniref:transglutaminase TgpA family protein n=1 Tax=Pseudonocardia sp. TaxID=60912 RepID=UPI0031FC06B7
MTASTAVRPDAPAPPPAPGRPAWRWISPIGAGVAVLLAGAPVSAVVQGGTWLGYAVAAVCLVVVLGTVVQRLGRAAVLIAQVLGLLELLTLLFTDSALPGPGAFASAGDLLAEAGSTIDTGTAPVAGSPGILLLTTAAFGLLAVAVHGIAVSADAPAAGGVPLLCVFAVPTALADRLLPWWAVIAAAAGFGVLLVARDGGRRHAPAGAVVVAVAAVVALLVGSTATLVGTGGRFTGNGAGGGGGGSIGLNPFTSLRGQLTQSDPVELFRVTGLPRATYLRALTLREYVPDTGWRASAPQPGVPVAGPLSPNAPPGDTVTVDVENLGFRDYWLPVYGVPRSVTGVDEDRWAYDQSGGTAYSSRPREEDAWQQQAVLPSPSAEQLRAASGPDVVDRAYLDTAGVDPRVSALAAQVTRGARTEFDKAISLVDFFTGPDTQFRYSLETAPGSGDDALVDFLTVGKAGYCEQYASAMAVMLRAVDVPARVAVGFTAGTDTADGRTVTTRDAHAWVEAWFPRYGWTPFDPTPLTDGRTVIPPYVQEAQNAQNAAAQGGQAQELQEDPRPAPSDPARAEPAPPVDTPTPQPTAGQDPGSGALGTVVLTLLVALIVLALLGGPVLARTVLRRRRLAAVAAGGPGAAAAAWAEILAESRDRGYPLPRSDTVRTAARRLVREHEFDDGAQDSLRDVVRGVEASWYGGAHPAPGELTDAVRAVCAAIGGTRASLRQRLLPASVVEGIKELGAARREASRERETSGVG